MAYSTEKALYKKTCFGPSISHHQVVLLTIK